LKAQSFGRNTTGDFLGDDSFRQQIRKKVLDMKSDQQDFYTETYNLVHTLIRLNPDAFEKETIELLNKKLSQIYNNPGKKHTLSLSQLEKNYFIHRADPNVRFRSKERIDLIDMKQILDKVRQDLLFYLALVEDRPNNFDIVLKNAVTEPQNGSETVRTPRGSKVTNNGGDPENT